MSGGPKERGSFCCRQSQLQRPPASLLAEVSLGAGVVFLHFAGTSDELPECSSFLSPAAAELLGQITLWVLPAVKLKTFQKDGGGSARVRVGAGSRVGGEALFNN